jgi:precorrin-3B methylase
VIRKTFEAHGLSLLSVHSIATLDKKGSEPGLVKCAHDLGLRITCFTPGELNTVQGITKSDAAFRATGALAVAEPAALLASGNTVLLVPKQKIGNVTIAIAELESPEGNSRSSPGKPTQDVETRVRSSACAARDKDLAPGTASGTLYIVGTGPGGAEHITPRAVAAIRESDVIVGYGTYLDLIRDVISDKQIVSTGMTQEVARGKEAIALARTGKTVSVISGGDPGVYAMAGLIFELLRNQEAAVGHGESDLGRGSADSALTLPLQQLHVEVIPGISALNACAAKLGAPLMHDFACISLSDRLTPWELIEKRLAAASDSDFVIVLYNPKSKGRVTHIGRAREIIMSRRTQDTPVGIVKAATRQDEGIIITTLGRMLDHAIDMQTTVIIGNSQSFVWDKWMVTPRGYRV